MVKAIVVKGPYHKRVKAAKQWQERGGAGAPKGDSHWAERQAEIRRTAEARARAFNPIRISVRALGK